MDLLTTIPLVVGVISNLGTFAMQTVAERLLTIVLAVFVIGGVSVFGLAAFAWLWLKRASAGLHAPTGMARHRG